MKNNRHYRLIAIVLLIVAIFFFIRRSGKDPYEIKGFDRDPADLVYTKHARCRMDCRSISEDEIRQILVKGEVNYSKSEPEAKPDPKYALEGTSADGQQLRIVFAQDDGKVVVITAIDLGKEWPCNCN
jgi:hypothetical protein